MIKAKLLEPQFPVSINRVLVGKWMKPTSSRFWHNRVAKMNLTRGHDLQRVGLREQTRNLKDAVIDHTRKQGWPKCREAHGHGVPIVVRDRDSLLHGEGGQVSQTSKTRRYAKCRQPKLF